MPIALSPEFSLEYALTSPNGSVCVFNNSAHAQYVGVLSEMTGLDSPEIREEAENRPGEDGGLHGAFLFGRRPITFTGKVLNPLSASDRQARIDKLQRAVLNCMRADGSLQWTTSSGAYVSIPVRAQQPLRITGNWQREFFVGLVAADPRIKAVNYTTTALSTTGGTISVTNEGSAPASPLITITGAYSGPVGLNNITTGQSWSVNINQASGETTVVNMQNKTVTKAGVSQYASVSLASVWWNLAPGTNNIQVSSAGASTGSSVVLQHQHSWY